MNLATYLSRKLSGTSSRTGRTGSVIAVLGVALALAVMEITMGVVIGFKHQITDKLEGFIAPVSISSPTDFYGARTESFISLNDTLLTPIKQIVPEAALVPVLTQPAIIKTDSDFAAIVINGHENDYDAGFESGNLVEGSWLDPDDGTNGLVISRHTASRTGLNVGDKTTLCFFVEEKIKSRPFVIKGIYDSGFGDFDKIIAYAPSSALRSVNKLDDTMITRLELRGIPVDVADETATNLSDAYYTQDPTHGYSVSSIRQEGAQYLNWLDLLNTNVVVIFILMGLVGAVTLISSLFILVLDKVSAIGILRSLGASDTLIRRLFTHLSLRLVGTGLIVGNIIGLGFIFTQSVWHYMSLDAEMYYLDSVPVEFSLWWALAVNAGVIVLALAVIMIPARFASRLSPVSTFRFE
ncbi:MAG: ABC transporter permease [Muribaculaceae bacterium]|nr:ABC transporter permease [Muribaculaceae bacterium]